MYINSINFCLSAVTTKTKNLKFFGKSKRYYRFDERDEIILDVSKLIMMSTSEFIDFKIERFESELILKVKPKIVDAEDNMGNKVKNEIEGKD